MSKVTESFSEQKQAHELRDGTLRNQLHNIGLTTILSHRLPFANCASCLSLCRAIAIRDGVVRFIVRVQECYTLGGCGGTLRQKNLGAVRLFLWPFLGQYNASHRQDNTFLSIVLYTSTGVSFPIRFAYQSKAMHTFAGEACETNCSRVRTKSCCTACSQSASFNLVPVCFRALRGRLPSNDTN